MRWMEASPESSYSIICLCRLRAVLQADKQLLKICTKPFSRKFLRSAVCVCVCWRALWWWWCGAYLTYCLSPIWKLTRFCRLTEWITFTRTHSSHTHTRASHTQRFHFHYFGSISYHSSWYQCCSKMCVPCMRACALIQTRFFYARPLIPNKTQKKPITNIELHCHRVTMVTTVIAFHCVIMFIIFLIIVMNCTQILLPFYMIWNNWRSAKTLGRNRNVERCIRERV